MQQQPYDAFLPFKIQEYKHTQVMQASTGGGREQQLDDHIFEYQQLW